VRIWLVKKGEYLPSDEDRYPFRMHMLAGMLAQRGQNVIGRTSTLDHMLKRQRAEISQGYWKNGSLQSVPPHTLR